MGPRNELGARRAEQFSHLGNYTLTPAFSVQLSRGDEEIRPRQQATSD